MHFLLLLLRFVLDQFLPSWRDGLTMAVRPDGRIEQIPAQPGWWERWLRLLAQEFPHDADERAKARARVARMAGSSPSDPAGGW
jgi:hypothetical protein